MHQTLRQTRHIDRLSPVARHPTARRLRAIFGGVLAASILTAAVGCDKRARGEAREAPRKFQTSLAGKPTVLFLLFGDRSDPRLLPVATIGHGTVTPISLDAGGWRNFDQLYFRTGSQVAVYRNGTAYANAAIRRGMWSGNEPLYRLPGCRALRPLAAAELSPVPEGVTTLEMLSTSDPLPPTPRRPAPTRADFDSARAVALRVGERGGLMGGARAELEMNVGAMHTGVSAKPTLVASYLEKGAETNPNARHFFILADSAGADGAYVSTFLHSAKDSVPEFRRLIDHVDLTGDGVDEIVLEGWSAGSDSYLLVMRYVNGKWREIARGANSWCADQPNA
jgi:hypothetical protein